MSEADGHGAEERSTSALVGDRMLDAGLVRGQEGAAVGSLSSAPVWSSFAAILLGFHRSLLEADQGAVQEEVVAPAFGLVDVEAEGEAGSCVVSERKAGAPGHTVDVHPL